MPKILMLMMMMPARARIIPGNTNRDPRVTSYIIHSFVSFFRSANRQRLVAHSTAMESIQAESEPIDDEDDVP